MRKIVLDTNVLVSSLWSPGRKPGDIVNAVIAGRFTICYDFRILEEYTNVLSRPRFGFETWQINALLNPIIRAGISVIPDPLPELPFSDESDRKFLEVARFCHALLVTGNIRHFPEASDILTVSDFHQLYL